MRCIRRPLAGWRKKVESWKETKEDGAAVPLLQARNWNGDEDVLARLPALYVVEDGSEIGFRFHTGIPQNRRTVSLSAVTFKLALTIIGETIIRSKILSVAQTKSAAHIPGRIHCPNKKQIQSMIHSQNMTYNHSMTHKKSMTHNHSMTHNQIES
jgi:hypothetical protein